MSTVRRLPLSLARCRRATPSLAGFVLLIACGPQQPQPDPCHGADRALELSIARCEDTECTELEPHPWGPQPPELGGVWTTSCTVASLDTEAPGVSTAKLDACSEPAGVEAPLGILVSLQDERGAVLELAIGAVLHVEYHSTRDDLTWLWRGWIIRDDGGALVAARTTGGVPAHDALDFEAISVSDFGCDTAPSYCGGTVRPGTLFVDAGDASVSVHEASAETLRTQSGAWIVAASDVAIYEEVACGAYSDYEHVELAIVATP